MNPYVLVIDDSPEIHDLLDERLKSEACVLEHEKCGPRALEHARVLRPDLILLDIDMPDISGFDLCRQLKQDPTTAFIPIIFLTSSADLATKVTGFDLGAVDYVTKPFEPPELRARVRAALRVKRYHDLLEARAQIDALTGLRNRAYFDARLKEEVAQANRYKRDLSLIMIDLDHFKRCNDDFGHPFGDQVLHATGEVLASVVRETDAACRYGGEEFAIILPQQSIDGARRAAERMRERLKDLEFKRPRKVVRITASFGTACAEMFSPSLPLTPERLIDVADTALFEAKRTGRDRICLGSVAVLQTGTGG